MSIEARVDDGTAARLVRESGLFDPCNEDEIAEVARRSELLSFVAGQEIVKEGDAAHHFYLLKEGEVVVLKGGSATAVEGRHEIARLGAGDTFGELALLDPGARTATVRALTPVTVLAIPISSIVALAEARPHFVGVFIALARQTVARLRKSDAARVETLDRALEEARTRVNMGQFTLSLIVAYSLYTFVLGTAAQLKVALGRSEFITVPFIVLTALIPLHFMRRTGYPPRFFGLTLQNGWRHALEAIILTAPLMAATIVVKILLLKWVPAMHDRPVFEMLGSGAAHLRIDPALILAYLVLIPFQELIYRGGLQGGLEHFLVGRGRTWKAILGSNIIFSAAHLYISSGLSVAAFFPGLFWGWLYSRQRSLVGVSISHIVLGLWAFNFVGLGVLE
ncbi:MAG TPA: cyclic nucleotide-binding domain-containing protein [Vicinamibacteria bacterium]|jgi:hypothetical protein